MWQRIQSVFLGVTIVSLIAGLFFPVWIGGDAGVEYRLYPIYFMIKEGGQITTSQYLPFCLASILMVAAATLAIMEFRKFDDRMLQIKLGTLNSLILAGVLICDVLFSNNMAKAHPVRWSYDYGLWLAF